MPKADRKKITPAYAAGLCALFVFVPLMIALGVTVFDDRQYYIVCVLIILLSVGAFALGFEKRRPQAKEIVLLASLTALGVAGRIAFYMTPQVKPSAAVIIIAGVVFGANSGFMCGAAVGFLSNFFFGQGPWTPWQMFAFGVVGFFAGVFFAPGRIKPGRLSLCVYGFLSVFILYGVIADTSSVVMFTSEPTFSAVMGVYASGIIYNLIHAGATVIFLFVIGMPLIKKLNRVKTKYAIS